MTGLVIGFQHVATITRDLDRLMAFYEEVFGARCAVESAGPSRAPFTRHAMIELAPGVVLHPFEVPDADLDPTGGTILDRGRIDHYAIQVRDRDAFELIRERIVARGAGDGEVTDFTALLSVGFNDPDGTRLEVCWVDPAVGMEHAREPEGFVERVLG